MYKLADNCHVVGWAFIQLFSFPYFSSFSFISTCFVEEVGVISWVDFGHISYWVWSRNNVSRTRVLGAFLRTCTGQLIGTVCMRCGKYKTCHIPFVVHFRCRFFFEFLRNYEWPSTCICKDKYVTYIGSKVLLWIVCLITMINLPLFLGNVIYRAFF